MNKFQVNLIFVHLRTFCFLFLHFCFHFHCYFILWSPLSYAASKPLPNYPSARRLVDDGDIISSIELNTDDPRGPQVNYANISTADKLNLCPLDDALPTDLSAAVKQLIDKVRSTVSAIKSSQTHNCQALTDSMTAAQNQMGTAINNAFVAGSSIAATASQNAINMQVQQANAVNLFITTASNMMQQHCIESINDWMIIQKLIGQIITLSGLFLGGWQGIGVAAGGQLIGNLPIFRSQTDRALSVFQKYDEVNERGSFLCLYRQMQKTSCLLYAETNDQVINGLDMSFDTGPARTTLDSVAMIRADFPTLLEDVAMLKDMKQNSVDLITELSRAPNGELNPIDAFRKLSEWCQNHEPRLLQDNQLNSQPIQAALQLLKQGCADAKTVRNESKDQQLKFFSSFYWALSDMIQFYEGLKKDLHSRAGKIASTWESFKYFEQLKKSVEMYSDPNTGNSTRFNYLSLTQELGNSLARESFRTILKTYNKTLVRKNLPWIGNPRLRQLFSLRLNPEADRIRKRTLVSMLDLCKTLDPTLACLYPGDPMNTPLYRAWKNRCVGPKSMLCREVLKNQEVEDLLADNTPYLSYFNSLCGEY